VRRALLVALALVGLSCAENGVLELTVQLPPSASAEAEYAVISMRSAAESSFDVGWATGELDGFLLESSSRTEQISVVAQPEDFGADLLVRARFCSTPRCDGLGDDTAGERRLVVEEPFYSLERTRAEWVIPMVEDTVNETADVVERCEVMGCRAGVTVSYCRSDGTHFCE
jgi:hypothetical protein